MNLKSKKYILILYKNLILIGIVYNLFIFSEKKGLRDIILEKYNKKKNAPKVKSVPVYKLVKAKKF